MLTSSSARRSSLRVWVAEEASEGPAPSASRTAPELPICVRVSSLRDHRDVPNCSGGLIQHIDQTIAGCTLDGDVDDCAGLEERHEYASEVCWQWWGRCDRCGIVT